MSIDRVSTLHVSCPGDMPGASPSEGWTMAVGSDRAQPVPKTTCPSCGRPASIEEWDSWRPGAGWRRLRGIRCRTAGRDRSRTVGTCGAVHVEALVRGDLAEDGALQWKRPIDAMAGRGEA